MIAFGLNGQQELNVLYLVAQGVEPKLELKPLKNNMEVHAQELKQSRKIATLKNAQVCKFSNKRILSEGLKTKNTFHKCFDYQFQNNVQMEM